MDLLPRHFGCVTSLLANSHKNMPYGDSSCLVRGATLEGTSAFCSLIDYLSKVLKNYTERACDGDFLSVRCPPRTTITVQSAFYGRRGASDPQRCPQTYQALLSSHIAREDGRYCSMSTALQVNQEPSLSFPKLHGSVKPISSDLMCPRL